MSLKVHTALPDLAHFPFNSIRFSVYEDRLVISLYFKDMCLKTWTSFTEMPIGSSLIIDGVEGAIDLIGECE